MVVTGELVVFMMKFKGAIFVADLVAFIKNLMYIHRYGIKMIIVRIRSIYTK